MKIDPILKYKANKGYFGASVKKLITHKFFTPKYNARVLTFNICSILNKILKVIHK